MSMRYPGGIISATAPTVNTTSAKGVWTLEQVAQYVKAGTWPVPPSLNDPYFEYVTTLLPGTGTNGAQNNTFIDSSTNNFTITRNGNSTQGTFSPFSQTGWGNYFSGKTPTAYTSISVPDSTPLTLGSSDFTIECWVNPSISNSDTVIAGKGTVFNSYGDWCIYANPDPVFYASSDGAGWQLAGLGIGTLPIGQWTHIAITRSGNTFRAFSNGVLVNTTTNSLTINDGNRETTIGGGLTSGQGGSRDVSWNGYISNFRIVKGTALYTTNFTPSTTPLTAVSGTSLLTCQSNRFVDNSTNAATITVNGSPSVRAFSPFNPTAAWSSSTNGGSGYFDGTGDYLGVSSLTFNPRTTVLTVEGWFYRTALATTVYFGSLNSVNFYVSLVGNNFYVGDGSTNTISAAGTGGPLGAWEYIAMSFDGTTYRLYQNGTLIGSSTTLLASNTVSLSIGAYNTGEALLQGYSSGVRFSNTARYTGSTMTVPTAPFTNDVNTSLLCNFTNAGIYDAASKSNFETLNTAQISTSQSKWGGGSLYFDHTATAYLNSYATQLNAPQYQKFGLVFTIEFWMYRVSTDSNQWILCTGQGYNNSTNKGFLIGYYPTSGGIAIAGTNLGAYWFGGGGTLNVNTWYHVAIVGTNSACTIYVNGVYGSNSNWPGGYIGFESLGWWIGAGRSDTGGTPSVPFGGYISDLRITNGVSRYTTNFTPPAAAFELF